MEWFSRRDTNTSFFHHTQAHVTPRGSSSLFPVFPAAFSFHGIVPALFFFFFPDDIKFLSFPPSFRRRSSFPSSRVVVREDIPSFTPCFSLRRMPAYSFLPSSFLIIRMRRNDCEWTPLETRVDQKCEWFFQVDCCSLTKRHMDNKTGEACRDCSAVRGHIISHNTD